MMMQVVHAAAVLVMLPTLLPSSSPLQVDAAQTCLGKEDPPECSTRFLGHCSDALFGELVRRSCPASCSTCADQAKGGQDKGIEGSVDSRTAPAADALGNAAEGTDAKVPSRFPTGVTNLGRRQRWDVYTPMHVKLVAKTGSSFVHRVVQKVLTFPVRFNA